MVLTIFMKDPISNSAIKYIKFLLKNQFSSTPLANIQVYLCNLYLKALIQLRFSIFGNILHFSLFIFATPAFQTILTHFACLFLFYLSRYHFMTYSMYLSCFEFVIALWSLFGFLYRLFYRLVLYDETDIPSWNLYHIFII